MCDWQGTERNVMKLSLCLMGRTLPLGPSLPKRFRQL